MTEIVERKPYCDPGYFLCSYTEKEYLRKALGAIICKPVEDVLGCDYYFVHEDEETGKLTEVGIQRKEFPGDFLDSLYSKLLAKELTKMQQVPVRILIIEGRGEWTLNGDMVKRNKWGREYAQSTFQKTKWSLAQGYGLHIETVDRWQDTIETIKRLEAWMGKGKGAGPSMGLRRDQKERLDKEMDWLAWIMKQIPDLGPVKARAIVKAAQGRPIHWWADGAELENVPGVGKVLADRLRRLFRTGSRF